MPRTQDDAAKWLKANDPKSSKPKNRTRKARAKVGGTIPPSRIGHEAPKGAAVSGMHPREAAAGMHLPTIKAFVEANRGTTSRDCIFVETSIRGAAAMVRFCGRQMNASRYACVLEHGAPKSEGLVARHLCGNGHLNCINPNHLVWGAPGDNVADANKHRALGEGASEQDKIHTID